MTGNYWVEMKRGLMIVFTKMQKPSKLKTDKDMSSSLKHGWTKKV